jgi:hypothetical protein
MFCTCAFPVFNNRNFVYLICGKFARPASAAEGEELEGLIGVWADEHAKKAGVLVVNNRQGKYLISSFCCWIQICSRPNSQICARMLRDSPSAA